MRDWCWRRTRSVDTRNEVLGRPAALEASIKPGALPAASRKTHACLSARSLNDTERLQAVVTEQDQLAAKSLSVAEQFGHRPLMRDRARATSGDPLPVLPEDSSSDSGLAWVRVGSGLITSAPGQMQRVRLRQE